MNTATVQVQIPAPFLQLGLDYNEIQRRVSEWLILSLFTDGHISSGKAARLLGCTRVEFLEMLRRRGIAYINFTEEELAEEIAASAANESGLGFDG